MLHLHRFITYIGRDVTAVSMPFGIFYEFLNDLVIVQEQRRVTNLH
jgi:hypothetical protein